MPHLIHEDVVMCDNETFNNQKSVIFRVRMSRNKREIPIR